jgi:hypothetical protein
LFSGDVDIGITLTTQNWLSSEPPFEHCDIARCVLSYVKVSPRALLLISRLGFPILSTCLLPLCLGNLLGNDETLLVLNFIEIKTSVLSRYCSLVLLVFSLSCILAISLLNAPIANV